MTELKTLKDLKRYIYNSTQCRKNKPISRRGANKKKSYIIIFTQKELKAEAIKWGKERLIEYPKDEWERGFNYGCFAILEMLNLDKEFFQNIKEEKEND